MQIRPIRDEDFSAAATMVRDEPHIVRHTTYTYWVLKAMDPAALLVAEGPDGVTGFLAGVYHFHPGQALLLQIVVGGPGRRAGLGSALAEDFTRRALEHGCDRVLLTIDEDNLTSRSFFQAFARRRGWGFSSVGDTGTLGGVLDPERIWELVPSRD